MWTHSLCGMRRRPPRDLAAAAVAGRPGQGGEGAPAAADAQHRRHQAPGRRRQGRPGAHQKRSAGALLILCSSKMSLLEGEGEKQGRGLLRV